MGPVGLHNIGQTCCLNSLIQVLVRNVGFAKILKRITVPGGAEEQRRSVPFQLLLLLEKMQDSRKKAVQPMELAYCLQKYNIPMFVQHDAAQLYLTVWNLIKNQITDVDLVARLQALYTIRLKESFVCLECTSEMSRDSSMLALPLSVFDMHWKPLKTLEDALHCFFQPQELSSKDKCFCGSCGRKTRWKQVLTLTHLPQTLTIHLMRFSIRNLRAEKVCHSLYFPQNLDLTKLLETKGEPCSAEEQVVSLSPLLPLSAVTLPHLDSQAIFICLHSGVLKHKSDAAAPLRRAFQGCHCWDVLTPDLASVAPCTPAPSLNPIPHHPPPGRAAGPPQILQGQFKHIVSGELFSTAHSFLFWGRDCFPDLSVNLV
ncbi:putative ubiquitin carboxyl-terminal hydrolase 41 isoform X1 [Bubalus bubalis]|uniref:putative ubiquitin carboxyl-terminal hydrolase 41 isoform X1 n=1 Tax=Bubalus bubalis TaxID=89462 RepID=UPI001D126705|nr:putative ubiquitin carboxyl-terminal hydrolase 41 isoform X1 [Bubalus bubalis]XP_044797280.1 putative ubiquitin carboxyl-terminal hydrolase 41 isoform X1 [Bubalus bubalis]XP_044797281.1 putative ubiquitin carboxyl-terminal hydrolase 41 isoform X1 [Bubalus bubalis]